MARDRPAGAEGLLITMESDYTAPIVYFREELNGEQLWDSGPLKSNLHETVSLLAPALDTVFGNVRLWKTRTLFRETRTLAGAGEGCFRGLFYEVSLALVGVASPAYFQD